MKKLAAVFTFLIIFSLSPEIALGQNLETDIAGFGFNQGIAAQEIPPNKEATVFGEDIQVKISSGCFGYPITFEILQGENDYFEGGILGEKKVLYNFAFRVRNHQTNSLIASFPAPVWVTVTLPENQTPVEVWQVELTRPLTISQSTATYDVSDTTFKMQMANPSVGWLITTTDSPLVQEIQPQGSAFWPIIGVFITGGLVLFLIRKENF